MTSQNKLPAAGASLLHRIRQSPNDKGLRLSLAEWLEQNDDPARAEFIRVQIEQEQLPEDDPRQEDLRRRDKDLRRAYGGLWVGPFFELEGVHCTFEGGMLEVGMTGSGLVNASREVPADAPVWGWVVDGLTLFDVCEDDFPELLDSHLLPRVDMVSVVDARALTWLGSATTLSALARLFAESAGLGDAQLESLAQSPFLPQLDHMFMSENSGFTARGIGTLVDALRPGSLKGLELVACDLGDDAVRPLARSKSLAGVKILDLSRNNIGAAGAEAFLASPLVQSGGFVVLGKNPIRRRFARHLRHCSGGRISFSSPEEE